MELKEGTCGRLSWQVVTGCGPRHSSGVGSAMRNRSNTPPSSAPARCSNTRLDRAARLTPWERVAVVAARHHHHDVWDQLEELGWKCVPEIMSLFERLKTVIDTAEKFRTLDAIYEAMPRQNFSSHILQRVPEQLAVGDAGCPLE